MKSNALGSGGERKCRSSVCYTLCKVWKARNEAVFARYYTEELIRRGYNEVKELTAVEEFNWGRSLEMQYSIWTAWASNGLNDIQVEPN